MSLDNQDMFAIYAAGLAKAFGLPANVPSLVLAGNATPANLACYSTALSPAPSINAALGQIYNLSNTEMYPQGFFDQTPNLFFNDYATYIDNLVPSNSQKAPTPTQQGQINMIKASLATATKQYSTDLTAASAAFTQASTLFPGQYASFASYLAQTSWGTTINTDANAVSGCNSQLSTIYTAVYGQDYVAIQLAKNTVDTLRSAMLGASATLPTEMTIDNGAGTGTLVVPTYVPGDLHQFSSWVDSTISQHGNTGQQPITISFNASSAHYDFSKSTYFSQTSWSTDYWFWSAGGSSTQSSTAVNVDTSSSSFGLTLGFDAVDTVNVAPGPWFDSSLMYAYKNAGNLVRPTGLLIGMYPSITLTMDSDSYQSAYAAYNSSSGFGVGPFFVSAGTQTSSSDTTMKATWSASSNSVTIASQSTTPILLGMQVTPLVA